MEKSCIKKKRFFETCPFIRLLFVPQKNYAHTGSERAHDSRQVNYCIPLRIHNPIHAKPSHHFKGA